MPDLYGLIGFPLSHSFSRKHFTEKFSRENISAAYRNFELADIRELPRIIAENQNLRGLNVTIPYKQEVIPLLDHLADSARQVGAVNVIKIERNGTTIGYNSDIFGFRRSLEGWLGKISGALILGTGGASLAARVALQEMDIEIQMVSRKSQAGAITYEHIKNDSAWIDKFGLIVNCTPLGTYPNVNFAPNLPYDRLSSKHFLYDMVYNPSETLFLKKGKEQGTKTKNGLEMLQGQAEKSWEIWNHGI